MTRKWLAVLALAPALAGACKGDPAIDVAEALRTGDQAAAAGNCRAAASAYGAAVEHDATGQLRMKRAQALRDCREWIAAAREASIAADLLPDRRDAQVLAISLLLTVSKFPDAEGRAAKLLAAHPDDTEVLVLAASARSQLTDSNRGLWGIEDGLRNQRHLEGARLSLRPVTVPSDDAEAERLFRRAYALDPAHHRTRLGLASFLWASGRFDEGADILRKMADEQPAASFVHRTLGLYFEARGRVVEAEKYLTSAAATGDRESQLALADSLVRRGLDTRALALLEPLGLSSDPDGAVAVRAAEISLQQGDLARSAKWVQAALDRNPSLVRALLVRSRLLLLDGNPAAALETARRAFAADPAGRETRLTVARALSATGDVAKALESFLVVWREQPDSGVAREAAQTALALGSYAVAAHYARQAVRLDPSNQDAQLTLATAQARLGDFAAAAQTSASLKARAGSTPEFALLQATIHAGRGEHDAARSSYVRILESQPDSLAALAGLVDLESRTGRTALAQAPVDRAIAAHPGHAGYLALAAQIAEAKGDTKTAEAILTRMFAADTANPLAGRRLTTFLIGQRRLDEARRTIDQALSERPDSLELQLTRAEVMEAQGQLEAASAAYQQIVSGNPEAWAGMLRHAALLIRTGGSLDVAERLASVAVRNLPDDPDAADTLGWVYLKKDVPLMAIPYLRNAVRARPESAVFRYHLGIAYERAGQNGKAREELTRALALKPDFADAGDARTVLARIKGVDDRD